jgi:glycosyltransferase involved in cell wall biosynthesis
MNNYKIKEESWILTMGSYPPRECGIATFTKDLTSAINHRFKSRIKTKILAMNRNGINIYNYPEEVILQIDDSNIDEYIETAKKINEMEQVKIVNIQHEFGLFGGEYGSYLVAFLELLNKPIVITFHSVLPEPNDQLKRIVQTLARKCSAIVVMAELGKKILRKDYDVKTEIEVIPHGIPTIPFISSIKEKTRKGYQDKILLSSFGMISSGKGYEYVINSLPKVVEKFPNLLYLIIGQTHPVVRREEGEKYRNSIERRIKKLNLEKNVKFYNKYITLQEIIEYLQATDIFICSNNDPNQITSGTLAYAVGAGRAVVSTPFLHAKELITPGRGILAKFRNPKSFEQGIIKILSDSQLKKDMEENAYANTRNMTWNNVALAYNNLFQKHVLLSYGNNIKIPEVNLNHISNLTDDFAMIQFAKKTEPDPHSGYTLDDNARAMIVCCMNYDQFQDGRNLDLIQKYLDFNKYVQKNNGKLYNLVEYNKEIRLDQWSSDAQGRSLWALGYLINTNGIPPELKKEAEQIFRKSLQLKNIDSPRAVAFTILGLHYFHKTNPNDENIHHIRKLADYLVGLFEDCTTPNWQWFEENMTYSNSKLPEALLHAYQATKDNKYLDIATSTLNFLRSITFENNIFAPIGQNGWYAKNGKKAYFDQQPVDTGSMVQTLMLAYNITGEKDYLDYATNAFYWFLGKNHLKQVIYDETTGGCFDGLGEFSINLNQGAESTISFQMARLALFNNLQEPPIAPRIGLKNE